MMTKGRQFEKAASPARPSLTAADAEREKRNAAGAMAMLDAFKSLGVPADEHRLPLARAIAVSLKLAPEPDVELVHRLRRFREEQNVSRAQLGVTLGISAYDVQLLEDVDISFLSVAAMSRWLGAIRSLADNRDVNEFFDVVYSALVFSMEVDVSRPALAAYADEIIEEDALV